MCDELLLEQLKSLIENERNVIANLANASALLHLSLEEINWAGFYLAEGEELILGPFQGKPACIRIPFGKGVCGTAAQTDTVQRIDNVHLFAGHIACGGFRAHDEPGELAFGGGNGTNFVVLQPFEL